MERVGALIHKLKEQYDQNVDKNTLLVTVQLLLAELEHEKTETANTKTISVILPKVHRIMQDVPGVDSTSLQEPEPAKKAHTTVEPTTEIPDTIKSYVLKPPAQPTQSEQQKPAQQKPAVKKEEQTSLLFDPVDEVPTLTHQKEVYELNDVHIDGNSLNDKLKEEKTELASTLKHDAVKDLRKAIGINDRYRFINELFRGDEAMYERSIKTINGFGELAEAESWIQRELKVKIGWNEKNETVKDFDQVVKRRFS